MKKVLTVALIATTLTSCTSSYSTCASYASAEIQGKTAGGSDTEGQDENKVFDVNGNEVN